MKRSLFVASSLSALGLTGCGVGNALTQSPLRDALASVQNLNHQVIGTRGMAKEYPDSAIDVDFRTNGLDTPTYEAYLRAVASDYRNYTLTVGGLVERPQTLSYARLRALPQHTQTTRHDCVEGWSAIGKWGGVSLADVLALAQPTATAKYVVFYCFDRDSDNAQYYESLDLPAATHPQTILALDLNGRRLDPDHGAPVRMRIPIQLGYKSAKWVERIALTDSLRPVFAGKGGYWEDRGYEWYAGI